MRVCLFWKVQSFFSQYSLQLPFDVGHYFCPVAVHGSQREGLLTCRRTMSAFVSGLQFELETYSACTHTHDILNAMYLDCIILLFIVEFGVPWFKMCPPLQRLCCCCYLNL